MIGAVVGGLDGRMGMEGLGLMCLVGPNGPLWAELCVASVFSGSIGEPNRTNQGISVPRNQEPNRNRFSRFRFFQFWFSVLSVQFSIFYAQPDM